MIPARDLTELLWPAAYVDRGTELYAVLDGARDPRVHRWAGRSTLASCCLYAGELPVELLAVAPHLVHVQADAAFTRELVADTWGRAWGIWVVCAAPFAELRRHLRRLLRVRDEAGRRLLFRYYDPIVLAAFLPACTAGELADMFGPIDAFLVESGSGLELVEFQFDGAALCRRVRTSRRLTAPAHSQVLELGQELVSDMQARPRRDVT